MNQKEDKGKASTLYKRYLTEGLIILALTISVYALVYAYNYGFLFYYRIPAEFASFSVASIFSTSIPIIGMVILLLSYASVIDIDDLRSKGRHSGLLLNIVILLIFSAATFVLANILMGGMPGIWISGVAVLLYIVLKYFVWPAIRYREPINYIEKVNKYIEVRLTSNQTMQDYIWNFALYRKSASIVLLVALIAFTLDYGYSQASNKSEYFVSDRSSNYVVAKFLDDKAILVAREKGNKLGKSIKIIEVTGDHTFTLQEVGHLSR